MGSKIRAAIIFLSSFTYYSLLSAKQYTWLFASGDSGNWLTASNWWIVPQPYGSPLYITLGHFLNLFPGDLVIKMTILLSCLPAAITVMLVYLIVKHLTNKEHLAIISSAILLGASIFLTQATILEQYSLAVMFVTLAYYFYLKDKKKLVALSLGLGGANHILAVFIAMVWLLLERKQWRVWLKVLPIYIASGILPYGLTIYLMASDAPRLVAGGLSWQGINSYLGSTKVFGSLAIMALPDRALDFVSLMLMSFGLAVIPIWLAFKKPWARHTKLLIISIAIPIWYYLTCLDPTAWTFMTYACPFIAVAVGIGLTKVKLSYAVKAVAISAVLLIITNVAFLNADSLAKAEPNAIDYYNEIQSMPDGSAVVTARGGYAAVALFYAMSEGKDVIPIFTTSPIFKEDALYLFYLEWMAATYNLGGSDTQEMVADALSKNVTVYAMSPMFASWRFVFTIEDCGLEHYDLVKGVDLTVEIYQDTP